MKIKWTWSDALIFILMLIPIAVLWHVYPMLPQRLAVHFGPNGANGFQDKSSFTWETLGLLVVMSVILKFVPLLDPRRHNYDKFAGVYEMVRVMFVLIMGGAAIYLVYYNLGHHWNVKAFTFGIVGIVIIVLGNFMGRIRSNFFVGIRTPWTISSDEVWRRTHRLAGPLFMAAGVVALVAILLPDPISTVILVCAIAIATLLPTVYSFIVYRQEM